MTGSVAIDIAIGLVFIFLLYSLLASIIQEMIANFFGLRARNLKQGIVRMLEDGHSPTRTKKNMFSGFSMFSDVFSDIKQSLRRIFSTNETGLLESFYSQPSIKYLASGMFFSKPSYISEANFSKAIMDILKEKGKDILKEEGKENDTDLNKIKEVLKCNIDNLVLLKKIREKIKGIIENNKDNDKIETLKTEIQTLDTELNRFNKNPLIEEEALKHIRSLLDDAQNDLAKFKVNLENWFSDTMERATGWYKRTTQLMLFIIGFSIAVSFNVSTIEIAKKLSKDDKARDQMVQLAMASAKEMSNNVKDKDVKKSESLLLKEKEKLNEDIDKANSILGFHLPDKIELKKDVTDKKTSSLKPNEKHIKNSANIYYIIEFSSKYIAEHAEPYYVVKKKNFGSYLIELFYSNEKWITQNSTEEIPEDEDGNSYVYLDKGKYFKDQFWGYLLTALAISLGATFWFDLLNKLIKLRSSVKTETKASGSKSTDGKIIKG